MIYSEAPLSDKSRQGAIEACPAFDGRGWGWVRRIRSDEKIRNRNLFSLYSLEFEFSHSLLRGDKNHRSDDFLRGVQGVFNNGRDS